MFKYNFNTALRITNKLSLHSLSKINLDLFEMLLQNLTFRVFK